MAATNTQGVAKILLFLGTITLFLSSFMGSTNSSWVGVQNAVSEPFPIFSNPFDSKSIVDLYPDNDGTVPPASVTNDDPTNVTNCDDSSSPSSNWWGCLLTKDAYISYDSTNNTHFQFNVSLTDTTGTDTTSSVVTLLVQAECRTTNATPVNIKVDFYFAPSDGSPFFEFAQYMVCKPGAFANQTLRQDFTALPLPTVGQYSNSLVQLHPVDIYFVDFSYVHVTLSYTSTGCTSADALTYIGCLITQGLTFIFNIGMFIINGLFFLGSAIFWLVSIIGTFLYGVIATLAWLLAIPGTPVLVQGIISIPVIASMGYLILYIVELVRGMGSGP